ncbi:carbonic anhydrase family protein [Luteimonas sp. BDR2-5]|uniref:carbonic anhydrase family protein n=1 Tax=Proluteimonas luteida TaxID=2878685 RepID=UPI001E28B096|nr:carbonic anhydrase family protein [Luteimonas sp. BDR2-5]MCD9027677.1 carbonic anhydrase family protein [Luteimonas sp. BDR2-5]
MFRNLALALAVTAACSAVPLSAQQLDYSNQQSWQSVHDQSQSPIDIQTSLAEPADPDETHDIVFRNTEAAGLKVVDNGHAVEIEVQGPDALIRGRHFELAQIHFHAASEHTIDGESFPLEGHYVFRAKDGRLAVVGVMYREGAPNKMAGEVLEALADADEGEIEHEDIAAMLPSVRSYHHYLGSLTTPPLTENVEWYVLDQPVTLSAEQIHGFEKRYSRNNRVVQPLNGRPLIHAAVQH